MEEFIWTIIIIFVIRMIVTWVRSSSSDATTTSEKRIPFGGTATPPDRLQFQFVDGRLGDDDDGPVVKEIKGWGPIPVTRTTRVAFVTSVFDETSGELVPVISAIEGFQEPHTTVYQNTLEVGRVSPNQGFTDWVRLGAVFPEILEPPYGGQRNMVAVVRMIDLDNPPDITHGFHDPEHPGLLFQNLLPFMWIFKDKGYKEAAEHREEATAITIKIGIAVAMADGSLENREGAILKQWIGRRVHHLPEQRQQTLKKVYNDAMRGAYVSAKQGELRLADLTDRMNTIADTALKYEAVELCFEVMTSDGVVMADEMKIIRTVASALKLDVDEIEKIRDQKLIGLDASIVGHAGIEDILGIQPDWDKEHITKHLRIEFQKWNNRINHLSEGQERATAQHMLDVIAEARQKYV